MQSFQHRLTEDDQLCYIHIPKTGGNTFNSVLEDHFPQEQICTLPSWYELPTFPTDWMQRKFIRGHVFYDIWKLLPRKPIFITMLRSPIERTISHYNMIRRLPEDPLHHLVKGLSFDEFLDQPHLQPLFVNLQTRYIAYSFDIHSVSDIATAEEHWDNVDVRLAQQYLSEFAFVGLTERMRDVIHLLCYTFGWKPHIDFQSQNRASLHRLQRSELSPKTLRKVEEFTRLDAELYQFAQRLFDKRFSQMMTDLLMRHSEKHFADAPPVHHRSIEMDFQEPISGTGWYPRESHPTHGYYRWTGPGTAATLDIALATEQDLVIQFRVIAAFAEDILNGLSLWVNDTPIPLAMSPDNGRILFQGVIGSTVLERDKPFTRLTFQVNRTVSPSIREPDNPDSRQLGVAINWLKIFPVE